MKSLDELRVLRSRAQVCAEKALVGARGDESGRYLLATGRGWFIDPETCEVRGPTAPDVELLVDAHPEKALEQAEQLLRVAESQQQRSEELLRQMIPSNAAKRQAFEELCLSALWRAIDARGLIGMLIGRDRREIGKAV